eukprot:gene28317-28646_t
MPRQRWLADLTVDALLRASQALPEHQRLNQACGSLHAAAWVSPQGELLEVMEDVGRHNALDKLLGHRARQNTLQEPGLVLMTSRASHELIRKCVRMGVGAMAAISAPTDFAVDIANRSGLQLWGLLRLLILAVTLAVAALTAVGFLADRLQGGLQRDARQLLGGDAVISSDNPPPPAFEEQAR